MAKRRANHEDSITKGHPTVVGLSPATIMGPPIRHEHGTTSSPSAPAELDACRPLRSCQPVGRWRVRVGVDCRGDDA